ncbi:MAG TPA: (Fe-S)-binding protein [Terriglobales bacterium]|nr:(Fe-S)-binding protein [Terriglobales bacterium]
MTRHRVALFIPCFVDQLLPHVAQAMVRVLERVGCQVEFPAAQTCCGQPAFSTGHWAEARPLALRFAEIFASPEALQAYDAVVCPSGSCTTMVRNFFPALAKGDAVLQRAIAPLFAGGGRVFEFSEYLVRQLHVRDVGAYFPYRVTFHDGCHALRELGLHDEPRELLQAVRGLELVEMEETTECCGFGGAFSMQMSDISAALGQRKAANVERAGVDFVTSCDPSCLMQIGGTLARQPGRARAIHLAEILAAGLDAEPHASGAERSAQPSARTRGDAGGARAGLRGPRDAPPAKRAAQPGAGTRQDA